MNNLVVMGIFLGSLTVYVLLIAAFDFYLYQDKIPGNSITQIIRKASKKHPIVTAAISFILGGVSMGLLFHLFDFQTQR